jgi:hypothetical protein
MSACKRPVILASEIPDEVAFAAGLELDDSGRVVGSSPLRPFADEPFWTELPDDHSLLLVGFDRAALLDPATGELPPDLGSDPIAIADDCSPKLPVPLWSASWKGRELEPAEDVPELTAEWLESRCVLPDARALTVDVRCDRPRCTAAATRDGPCSMKVETAGCDLGIARLRFVGDRIACVELEATTSMCVPDADSDRLVFECAAAGEPACTTELIPAALDEAPRFEIVRRRFGELESEPAPDVPSYMSSFPRPLYAWGQAFGFAVFGSKVAVAAIDGDSRYPCPGGDRRRLLFFDVETLEPAGTAPAPDCLEPLEPAADGFVGAYRDPSGLPAIGRFDAAGAMVDSGVFAGLERFYASRIVSVDSGWVVLLQFADMPNETRMSALVYVSSDLDELGRYVPGGVLDGLGAAGPARIAIYDGGGTDIRLYDLPDFRLYGAPVTVPSFSGYRGIDSFAIDDRLVVLSDEDNDALIHRLEDLARLAVIAPILPDSYTISGARWANTSLVIAGGTKREAGRFSAHAYFIDPIEGRFLAGERSLEGDGPASIVRADDRGRVWALLPWPGELLRLEPLR